MSSMFSIIRNVISVFIVGLMCHLIVVNGNNEFELRLIPRLGSSLSGEGRVEVFQRGEDKGVWGNICDQGWDEKDAIVACRQLGFGNVGFPLNGQSTNSQYGNGDGEYLYSQFNCNGSENALRDCPYKTYSTDMGCSEMQAAGLMCFSDLDVRLISDTSGNTEGRLELFYKGDWSNVRIDDFDGKSANVACKQVRGDVKSAVGIIVDALRYGEDEGNCQFSNFKCKGNESYIRECDYTRSSTRESCVKLVAIKCDDPCNPSPCENDGVCEQTTDGGVICRNCKSGYSGRLCTIGTDGEIDLSKVSIETIILATSLGFLALFLIFTLLVNFIHRVAFRHAIERIVLDADRELESKDGDDLEGHVIGGNEYQEWEGYDSDGRKRDEYGAVYDGEEISDHEGYYREEREERNSDEFLRGTDEQFEGSLATR